MAKIYAQQQVGVADGTKSPPVKQDGRQVGAHVRVTLASKVPGTQWAIGDTIYLGKKPAGQILTGVRVTADTSFGTSTLSIGTPTTPAKYVDAKTVTATDTPTPIGPKASTLDDGPSATEEELWLTVGVAAIVAATLATFELTFAGA